MWLVAAILDSTVLDTELGCEEILFTSNGINNVSLKKNQLLVLGVIISEGLKVIDTITTR
jgi:hypothetical protein